MYDLRFLKLHSLGQYTFLLYFIPCTADKHICLNKAVKPFNTGILKQNLCSHLPTFRYAQGKKCISGIS